MSEKEVKRGLLGPKIMAKEGPGSVFGVLLATRCDMLRFHVWGVSRDPNRVWRSVFEPTETDESSTGAPGRPGSTEDSANAHFRCPGADFLSLILWLFFWDLKK